MTGGKARIRHFVDSSGRAPLDASTAAALHAFKTQRYAQRIRGGDVALRPGIARIVGEARGADVALAIATTTSVPNIETLLDATLGPGSIAWFAAVGAGDMVEATIWCLRASAPSLRIAWRSRTLATACGRPRR